MFKEYNEKTFVTTMASDLQMLCDVISREYRGSLYVWEVIGNSSSNVI